MSQLGSDSASIAASTIMVVEDNPDLREVLGLILKHHGFDVVLASDGVEAVERASQHRPDVVLMDLMMPRMNGYEARAALNDNGSPPIPVIAITASLVSREEITARGFVDLLRKPVRSQEVVETIRRYTA